jgi:hypothetical protein
MAAIEIISLAFFIPSAAMLLFVLLDILLTERWGR